MKNKISPAELINGIFIFLFGTQIISQNTFWILPIDTNALFGHTSYIVGSALILKSIFIIKINLYNKKITKPSIDYSGFITGLFVLIYGAHVIQSGVIHNKGPSIFFLTPEEKYVAGIILIFSGVYMLSHSYRLRKSLTRHSS